MADSLIIGTMKRLTLLFVLTCCLVFSACSGAGDEHKSNKKPVIYSISPDKIDSIDMTNRVSIAVYGSGFGAKSDSSAIYYTGQAANSSHTHKTRLEFINGGSWSDNLISVYLYRDTLEEYPKGHFSVYSNGRESELSNQELVYNPSLNNAAVSSISPKEIYSYDLENKQITIIGSGFGSAKQSLELYDMSTSGRSRVVEPFIYSDTSISFFYPSDFMPSFNTVIGIKAENSNRFLGSFNYVAVNPRIDFIWPQRAAVGDIITIHSNNGGWGIQKPESFYCNIKGVEVDTFNSWGSYAFSFTVPDGYYIGGSANISIYIYGKTLKSNLVEIGPYIENIEKIAGNVLADYVYRVTGYGFASTSVVIGGGDSFTPDANSVSNTTFTFTSSSKLSNRLLCVKPFSGSKMCSNYFTVQ